MSKFKSLITGAALVGAVAFASTAMADGMPRRGSIKDAPYVAPFSWTGFYVGVNGGYAWGDSKHSSSFSCTVVGNCPFVAASEPVIANAASGTLDANGWTGGVQAGYNIQAGSLVYGVEVDFNYLDVNGSRAAAGTTPAGSNFVTGSSVSADWLMTARARLGWTMSSTVLAYVTGGLAVADLEVSNNFRDFTLVPATQGASSSSDTKLGWTVGGGLEVALNRNWTLKGEYLYVDFGRITTAASVNNVPFAGNSPDILSTSGDLSLHTARVGLNYKF